MPVGVVGLCLGTVVVINNICKPTFETYVFLRSFTFLGMASDWSRSKLRYVLHHPTKLLSDGERNVICSSPFSSPPQFSLPPQHPPLRLTPSEHSLPPPAAATDRRQNATVANQRNRRADRLNGGKPRAFVRQASRLDPQSE